MKNKDEHIVLALMPYVNQCDLYFILNKSLKTMKIVLIYSVLIHLSGNEF